MTKCGKVAYYLKSKAGISKPMVKTIYHFLDQRSFRVRVGNKLSTDRPLAAGVPQGSVLGPTIYNIYTHDIPEEEYLEKALFADDTAVITQSRDLKLAVRNLQTNLNILTEWFKKWKIAINEKKTQAVLYTKRRRLLPDELTPNNTRIRWTSELNYLGLTIDHKLTWNSHTTKMKQKGFIAMSKLYPVLSNHRLGLRTKRLLYTAIIRPVITYAAPVWGCAAETHIKKIQVIQNKILRIITKAPWFVTNRQVHPS